MGKPPSHPNKSFPLLWESSRLNARQLWYNHRFAVESKSYQTQNYGKKSKWYWKNLYRAYSYFEKILKWTGYYQQGNFNAWNVQVRSIELFFPNLPSEFDGFKILHLSDLHIDGMPGLEEKVLEVLGNNTKVDLCVFTGDYRKGICGPFNPVLTALQHLVSGIDSQYGFLGTLGNHDTCLMVEPLEQMGIQMLINENHWIEKNGERLQVIGTDDVHFYFTEQAIHALETANQGFTIGLVHSPELYEEAAYQGIDLYLCGHTHGGQICLPSGIPIQTNVKKGKKYYAGHWQHRQMQGFTSAGVGTSVMPIRFNIHSEVVLITLYRQDTD